MSYSLAMFVFIAEFLAARSSHEKCYSLTDNRLRCYTLYGNATQGITWEVASRDCLLDNKTLVSVSDGADHANVGDFLREMSSSSAQEIWTSGRRSDSNKWKYLHSAREEMLNGNYPSDKYCAVRPALNDGPRSVRCTEKYLALCQYKANHSADRRLACGEKGFSFTPDTCLAKGDVLLTWFQARNYCRNKYPDGDLSVIAGDLSDMEKTQSSGTGGYWIGLQRRPWMWTAPHEDKPVDVYYFDEGEGSDYAQSCLFLKVSPDGALSWADAPCSSRLNYYMCEANIVGNLGAPATSSDLKNNKLNTVYVAVGVSVVAIVIVVIILAYTVLRWRRAKKQATTVRRKPKLGSSDRESGSTRIEISDPLPMKAPFRVSGYDNLGALIPVKRDGLAAGESTRGGVVATRESALGGSDTLNNVSHVTVENGDEYAIVKKSRDDAVNYPVYSNVRDML